MSYTEHVMEGPRHIVNHPVHGAFAVLMSLFIIGGAKLLGTEAVDYASGSRPAISSGEVSETHEPKKHHSKKRPHHRVRTARAHHESIGTELGRVVSIPIEAAGEIGHAVVHQIDQ